MRISRIYVDTALDRERIKLPKDRLHYLQKVLRLADGATLHIFDGRGNERVAELSSGEAVIGAALPVTPPPTIHITLIQGISRGERMDQTVQKATELGVSEIVPVTTEHCEVKLRGDRAERRLAHWRGVMISACEQSGRAELPLLQPITSLPQWIEQRSDDDGLRLLLSPDAESPLNSIPSSQQVALAIGPEGGFSPAEEEQLIAASFCQVLLGPRLLRTETAGPAAIAALHALWGDFT